MRTLVEQTRDETRKWLLRLARRHTKPRDGSDLRWLALHSPIVLMGGEDDGDWDIHPERNAILIGTQDMLLSRALNRGYGTSRFRWPMHFGLLNNDCLWVMDETQLMGVGVETSAQLDGFRHDGKRPVFASCPTWWMSATLSNAQLDTVDHRKPEGGWETIALSENEKQIPEIIKRIEAHKPVTKAELHLPTDKKSSYEKNLAAFIVKKHQPETLTLVIVNRVNRAQAVYEEVRKLKGIVVEQVAVIHSRFRPKDRKRQEKLLSKKAKGTRIVIATQAVEAGVDVSARLLITEPASWSSLVQRFGRCNRYGERTDAEIVWIDLQPKDEKDDDLCLPYDLPSLKTARENLEKISDASPLKLAAIKVEPKPVIRPVLRRKDLLDLFDTTADLCGQDLDVSRYIRDSDDNDVQFFWRKIGDDGPSADEKPPHRDELCRVSIRDAAEFLKKTKARAWRWNPLEKKWEAQKPRPGAMYLLDVTSGGYKDDLGWTADPKHELKPHPPAEGNNDTNEGDPNSFSRSWQTIAEHTGQVIKEIEALTATLAVDSSFSSALRSAALWHDVGKAHDEFQKMLRDGPYAPPDISVFYAKSQNPPKPRTISSNWRSIRHELASALAWLLSGPPDAAEPDLVAYLIAAHHGKVRLSIRSLPDEKGNPEKPDDLFARGLWDGDQLPAIKLDEHTTVGPVVLDLSFMQMGEGERGPSWLARMVALRDRLGPFGLAYLETLLRAADARASRQETT